MKPVRVKFGKKVVIFRHAKATAATHAARVRAGKRLARMWTPAERMANLRKAWKAKGIHTRRSNPAGGKIVLCKKFRSGEIKYVDGSYTGFGMQKASFTTDVRKAMTFESKDKASIFGSFLDTTGLHVKRV